MKTKLLTCLAVGLLLTAPWAVNGSQDEEEDDLLTSFELTYPYPVGEDDIYFQRGNSIKELSNGNVLIAGLASPETSNSQTGLLLEVDQNGDEVWFSTFLKADERYTSELYCADEFGVGKWFFAVGDSEQLPFDLADTDIYNKDDEEEEEEEEEDEASTQHDDEEEEPRTSAIFARYGGDGDLTWAEVSGDNIEGHTFIGRSVTINNNGDSVFVASTNPIYRSFFGKMSKSGDLKWGKELRAQLQQVIPLQDGYLISGVARYGSGSCVGDIWSRCGARLFYIKISEDGEEIWGRVWGINMSELREDVETDTADSRILDDADQDDEDAVQQDVEAKEEEEEIITEIYHARVSVTTDGGFIFTGSTSFEHSLFVLKTDSEGVEQWSKFYSSPEGVSEGLGIVQSTDGGYMISGVAHGQVDASNHFDFGREFSKLLLLKVDKTGEIEWSKVWKDPNQPINEAKAILQDDKGSFWVTGFTSTGVHYSEVKLNNLDPFEKNYNFVNPQLIILKVETNGHIAGSQNVEDVELQTHDKSFSAMSFDVDFTHVQVKLSSRYPKKSLTEDLLGEDFTLFNILLMGGVIIAFLILIIWGVCLRMGKKSEEAQPLNEGV
eukprot:CAMPEP_0115015446 /NCGR_PEP_ID=MMETSP0216-20121206/26780_1 /TAXON_ID=223996 /ORGANISM="Protocruzia adherens, Strain Boccale" /LENGTH=607 /DNA_ID=CAMNT_0002385581 /DNA_START=422 /DNA_END=2241 /DNA_ORIENTATION=+